MVWCGEEDVVEPEGRVHQGNLNPVLALGGGRREEEGRGVYGMEKGEKGRQ